MLNGNSPSDESPTDESATDRRTVLKATGTTIAAGTGLAATSGSASAQFFGGGVDVIGVDEGGFFGGGWSADDDLPVTDEVLIYIHGWFGDTMVETQASDILSSVESGGYSPDETVALEWPGTTLDFGGAEGDTENVGEVAADLVEDFYDAGGGNVRLTGHSLGGRCVYWAATKMSSHTIDTVAGLGTAADGSEICGSPWNAGLSNADDVRNYHSNNDSIVGGAYGGFGDTALGNEGAGCDPASNYTDVDVSSDVGAHLDYMASDAVGEDLASAIQGDGGGDGGFGGGFGGSGDGGFGWSFF